jgi:hypothetical protein
MPTQRSRLTKTEDQEYRARLSGLEQVGIPIGHAGDPSHEPDGLTLEQTEDELASIYELPLKEVAVVVPVKMKVLRPGGSIMNFAMMTPWDDWPLELSDLEGRPYYQHLIGGLYHYPPILLNDWLTGEVPLRPGKVEGVIIAYGYIPVPSQCHDETLVTVQLLLEDERRKELSFDFGVRVNRRVMRKWERRQRDQLGLARWNKGVGLYEPKRGQPGDQKSVSRERAIKQPHASGEHDATYDARTPETKLGDR